MEDEEKLIVEGSPTRFACRYAEIRTTRPSTRLSGGSTERSRNGVASLTRSSYASGDACPERGEVQLDVRELRHRYSLVDGTSRPVIVRYMS